MVEDNIFDKVHEIDLRKTMEKSYIDYAMSVIAARALPDVRDGLKPVQRRVLFSMIELNNGPDKPHRKCARIVGDTMGKYHPHGDSSIYGSLVNMAQDWSTRYPLVDGHGNFGSVDGDGAAAMRYTEARLSKISMELLADINKNTVDFVPNFDETEREPAVLPARYPNLLVNGTTGIAVGMATNIPPHNLGEIIDAAVYLLDNEDAEMVDLMEIVKGPDFPTGGIIMGQAGIRAAYATGRGRLVLRGRAEIEEWTGNRFRILITEIPYMVNKAKLLEAIADLVKDKRIEGITGLRDESNREGMRIVVELKREANPSVVLNQLYSFTQLQDTIGIIMLALQNGEPKVMSLKEMLDHYLAFQCEVIERRIRFELKKARERAHILDALKTALDFIDEVINILRASKSVAEGKAALMERFDFDDVQASAIVAMRLGQLTGLERVKLEDELAALKIKIEEFLKILSDKALVREIIKTEMLEIRAQFADERRTEILAVSGEVDIEDLIPVEDCVVTLTELGYIKRQTTDTYRAQKRGGRGITGMTRREEDFPKDLFFSSTHDTIMFFSNLGLVYRLKCYEIPEGSRTSKGLNIINLLPLQNGETITSMIRVDKSDEDRYLIMVTRKGIIKRTRLELYKNIRKGGLKAVVLDEGDQLTWVRMTFGSEEMILATKNGLTIRFNETDVREMGRVTRGVKAINLAKGDEVVGMELVDNEKTLLTISDVGLGRRSRFEDYRLQNRGGKGLTNYKTSEEKGSVAGIAVVDDNDDIIVISSVGIIIRVHVSEISTMGRYAKGVKTIRLPEGAKVVSFSAAPREPDIEEQAFDEPN